MKKLAIIVVILLCFNCSNESVDGNGSNINPGASSLVFPDNNQECNQGIDGPGATQSTVTFRWSASANTNSYTVRLKNLNTQNTTSHISSTNELAIPILKGTPYSWFVISENDDVTVTAQSPTWKFYNAGEPVTSYAPFPADLISPVSGSTFSGITSQTLSWMGSDIDNDIVGYDVYFDTGSPPASVEGNTSSTSMDVSVTSGNTYYWRIVTTDIQGNTSQSEIFQFRVE